MPRHVPVLPAVSCPVVDIRLLARGPQAGERSRAELLKNRSESPGRIAGRVLLWCYHSATQNQSIHHCDHETNIASYLFVLSND